MTPALLKRERVKLLLCDLDNTLRLHSEKEPADELAEWVADLTASGIKIAVVSNNGRKRMMQRFCKPLGIPCFWWARKPVSTKLTEAMKSQGFEPIDTAMLGDKWSTDVLAARFAGVRAWQVEHRKKVV